jgi:hypothetical protein
VLVRVQAVQLDATPHVQHSVGDCGYWRAAIAKPYVFEAWYLKYKTSHRATYRSEDTYLEDLMSLLYRPAPLRAEKGGGLQTQALFHFT